MNNTFVTTAQLSYMWNVTKATIAAWSKIWLMSAKTSRGKFDAQKAHALYVENQILAKYSNLEGGESLDEAKRRHEIARADRAELQTKEMQGELIQRDEAVKWLSGVLIETKTGFLAIPRRISPVLYGKDVREIEGILRMEIRAILEKMAKRTKSKKNG